MAAGPRSARLDLHRARRVSDALKAIRTDLARIVDEARWSHVHGYWKAGHGLTAERGTSTSRSERQREDDPVYDLEIGDHRAREAYQHAVRTVHRANVLAASLVHIPQPAVQHLDAYDRPERLVSVANDLRWRLDQLTGDEKRLTTIRKSFDKAVRGFARALDEGTDTYTAHKVSMCRTCKIRPQAERPRPDGTMRAAKAGECSTCAEYRLRTGETRDAQKLDHGPINEARAAQARRLARGEGWGVA